MNILVLFSYGSVTSIDDVAAFYDDIYHGTATEEHIQHGIKTYDAHGMPDPLATNTTRVGKALVKKLSELTGEEWTSYVANHHTEPSIPTVAEEILKQNPKRVATFSLTPFDSLTGRNAYAKRLTKLIRAENTETEIIHLSPFAENPLFIDVLADRVRTAYEWLPERVREEAQIVFTAHSKPGTEKAHETMITQYKNLAENVASLVPVKDYHIAYRSGKPLPQRWLGPDVLDVVDNLAEEKAPAIIFVEALSVIENLEAIEEITEEAVGKAKYLGMQAVQSEFLNDSADFIDALLNHISSELQLQKEKNPTS